MYEALSDRAGGAENASANLSPKHEILKACRGTHPSPLEIGLGQPPSAAGEESFWIAGPMRGPRTRGLKGVRTPTNISVSAASGRTLGGRTFSPAAAREGARAYESSGGEFA